MDPLDHVAAIGQTLDSLEIEGGTQVWVGAADDQVLRKLRWYQMGGEVSDRQRRDVVSILTLQGDRIDRVELLNVAKQTGLEDLVRRATSEADEASPYS